MNWAQFKDPVFHMSLAATLVASWSLTKKVTGWQVRAYFTVMTNIFVSEFSKTLRKTHVFHTFGAK